MDYYKLSNDLRCQCQLLQKYSLQVFEVSLNSSILSENSLPLRSIADNLGKVSKEVNEDIAKLLLVATHVCRNTLDIKRNYILHDQLVLANQSVHQDNNKNIVQITLNHMMTEIKKLNLEAFNNIESIQRIIHKIVKLNEKLWVCLNNIKIELSLNPTLKHFEPINLQLEDITQKQGEIFFIIFQQIDHLFIILKSEMAA